MLYRSAHTDWVLHRHPATPPVGVPHGAAATVSPAATPPIAVMQRQPERAARLRGAAEALFDTFSFVVEPPERAEHDRYAAAARAQLGEATFAAAWAAGRAMTLDQAIAYALDQSDASY